jgi:hypothetical protein
MPYLNFEWSSERREISKVLKKISSRIKTRKELDTILTELTVFNDCPSLCDSDGDVDDGTKSESSDSETSSDTECMPMGTSSGIESDREPKTRKRKSKHRAQLDHDRSLILSYLDHKYPLHVSVSIHTCRSEFQLGLMLMIRYQVRRTLDQFHYYMLPETEKRDTDQVALRWTQNGAETQVNREDGYIVMVDQLWLWVFGGRNNLAPF